MGQLRKKLEPDPAHPRHLMTEAWVGYKFTPAGVTPPSVDGLAVHTSVVAANLPEAP